MCQISRLLLWKSPQECQNVTIEFCFTMRILYELRYTVIIEIVWTFYLKSVPVKFQKYFKLISWVISGTSSSKLSCNPRHPSRNISCNYRHHLLQPSWRRIFSTSNNQKTRVDSDINIDYKASLRKPWSSIVVHFCSRELVLFPDSYFCLPRVIFVFRELFLFSSIPGSATDSPGFQVGQCTYFYVQSFHIPSQWRDNERNGV